ncbi:MAG: hypothetical protein IID33_09060, partial [Planctomycetes bacterium]|nr:hypothetical protein [Planctomycetota bacterium]
MTENQKAAPVVIIFGDEPFERVARVKCVIDELLPPEIDRAMALSEYDGGQREEQ